MECISQVDFFPDTSYISKKQKAVQYIYIYTTEVYISPPLLPRSPLLTYFLFLVFYSEKVKALRCYEPVGKCADRFKPINTVTGH